MPTLHSMRFEGCPCPICNEGELELSFDGTEWLCDFCEFNEPAERLPDRQANPGHPHRMVDWND